MDDKQQKQAAHNNVHSVCVCVVINVASRKRTQNVSIPVHGQYLSTVVSYVTKRNVLLIKTGWKYEKNVLGEVIEII